MKIRIENRRTVLVLSLVLASAFIALSIGYASAGPMPTHYTNTATGTVPAGAFDSGGAVFCNPGDTATGGGGYLNLAVAGADMRGSLALKSFSVPAAAGDTATGWGVSWSNPNTFDVPFTVQVLCLHK